MTFFPRFNKLFKQLQEKEIAFVVASGNQYFQFRTFFLRNYKNITFLSENGANILIGDQHFCNAELPKNIVMHTLNTLDKLDPINLIVCGKKSAYILEDATVEQISNAKFYYPRIRPVRSWNELFNENDTFFKFALSFDPSEITEKLTILQTTLKGSLIPISSGHGNIDLIIPGVNKYTELKYSEKNGIFQIVR
nr:HAD hydrolase family protein [Liquorilactobacillus mali]